jgi:hypothetical protein
MGGQVCNAATGTCDAVAPIGSGSSAPTGEYYMYAAFSTANSCFLGGADVGGNDKQLYVNRDGSHVDVYEVEIQDSDDSGKPDPNQHPDNPQDTGPIETRTLKLIKTYNVPVGSVNSNEIQVLSDRLVYAGYPNVGSVFEYAFGTGVASPLIQANGADYLPQVLGYDSKADVWYGGGAYHRRVYSYDAQAKEWVLEFQYASMAGDHFDGLEVVTDRSTGVAYVYVSDMTSDFIGQYRRDSNGKWVENNLFQYSGGGALDVEGMGYGPMRHFWVTNDGLPTGTPQTLYEIGGGALGTYLE